MDCSLGSALTSECRVGPKAVIRRNPKVQGWTIKRICQPARFLALDMVKFDNLLLDREQDALNSADFTLDQKHHAAGKSNRCF